MKTTSRILVAFVLAVLASPPLPARGLAQQAEPSAADTTEADPASALVGALTAACRQRDAQFARYLTADNAAAFRALPASQRAALMQRLSLAPDPGHPLLSSGAKNHIVLRCQAGEGTAEFQFGDARLRENLAFIPITVAGGQQTVFGMVRENGGWRLLSLGLVLFDIPQLSKEWAAADTKAMEDVAIRTLRELARTIAAYQDSYGRLPESLAEMGPAPKGQISPEQANLVNADIATGKQDGYLYRYRIVPGENGGPSKFELAATPEQYGKTGERSFFLDTKGVIHGADRHGTVASPDDPAIPAENTP